MGLLKNSSAFSGDKTIFIGLLRPGDNKTNKIIHCRNNMEISGYLWSHHIKKQDMPYLGGGELKRLKYFTSCNFSRTGTEMPLRRQTTAEYFQSFILKRGEISFAEAFDKLYNNW